MALPSTKGAARKGASSRKAASPRRTRTKLKQGLYGDEAQREMRHEYGSVYSATEQKGVPEPPGHRPQGDRPLAGYDFEEKPTRRRRSKR